MGPLHLRSVRRSVGGPPAPQTPRTGVRRPGSGAELASLPIAAWLQFLTLAQLFVVAALAGLGEVFFNTAQPNIFVNLVARDAYVQVNCKISTVRSASFLAGPAVGGFLIQALTAPLAILVDAASFLASAFLIGHVDLTEPPPHNAHRDSLLAGAKQGLTFVRRHQFLRASLGCAATLNFFNFIGAALLILFASRELGLTATLIGLALGAGASGGLAAALLAPRIGKRLGIGVTIILGASIAAAGLAIVPLASGEHTHQGHHLRRSRIRQRHRNNAFRRQPQRCPDQRHPDQMRSRASGAFSTINYGVRPLGAMVGGLLGTTLGLRSTLFIAELGMTTACIWLLTSPIRTTRDMKQLDDISPYTGAPARPSARMLQSSQPDPSAV